MASTSSNSFAKETERESEESVEIPLDWVIRIDHRNSNTERR